MIHDAAIGELLPFYVNGTLDADDRARVEAELAACMRCAHDVRELQFLAQTLRAHAEGGVTLSPRVLPAVLDRIAPLESAFAPVELRRSLPAWWSIPLSYVASLVLVIGGGAVAAGLHGVTVQPATSNAPHRVTLPPSSGAPAELTTRTVRIAAPNGAPARRRAAAVLAAAGGTLRPSPGPVVDALLPPSAEAAAIARLAAIGPIVADTTQTRDMTSEAAAEAHAIAMLRAHGGATNRAALAKEIAWRNALDAHGTMHRVRVELVAPKP